MHGRRQEKCAQQSKRLALLGSAALQTTWSSAFREPRGYVHRPLRGNSRPRRTTIANSEFGKLFISAPFLEHTSPCRARGCGRGNVEPISLFVICIIDITSEGGTSDASGLGSRSGGEGSHCAAIPRYMWKWPSKRTQPSYCKQARPMADWGYAFEERRLI